MSDKTKKTILITAIIVSVLIVAGIAAFFISGITVYDLDSEEGTELVSEAEEGMSEESSLKETGYEENEYDESGYDDSGYESAGNGDIMTAAYEMIEDGSFGEKTGEALQLMIEGYDEYKKLASEDPERVKEVTPAETVIETENTEYTEEVYTISMGGHQMKYMMEIVGEPDENGLYPLYITLHGGGESSEEENNGQWMAMKDYYRESVDNGIYVATRGMEDVWNLHFLDYSYPMYDRLIEDMVLLKNADPNRVYLMGFSAGGDGVYAIAPRMADRFAAANMSSGHPNDVCLLNISNLPFEIQVGIRDYYSETAMRSIRGAEFEDILNAYRDSYGFGYDHRILVHVPEGHNYNDSYILTDELIEMYDLQDEDPEMLKTHVLKDPSLFAKRAVEENWLGQFLKILKDVGGDPDVQTLSYETPDGFDEKLLSYVTKDLGMEVTTDEDANAVHFVDKYTRNPVPMAFVWDFETRAPERGDTAFYWLKADYSVNKGSVEAVYEEDSNTVSIEDFDGVNGDVTILANPFLMDFDRPLTVETAEGSFTVDLEADSEVIENSIIETGDIFLSWADEVKVSFGE
ncbi:MAG: hypothetical protein J6P45_07200 [Lachnospiraceae bacterium]|nr:hypothetical protein [Lachnospiraceae bacterium]